MVDAAGRAALGGVWGKQRTESYCISENAAQACCRFGLESNTMIVFETTFTHLGENVGDLLGERYLNMAPLPPAKNRD